MKAIRFFLQVKIQPITYFSNIVHFLIVGYDTVYSSIENHQPCGIASDDLRKYPRGSAYLIISAFVGDEAVHYLLPDALI